MDVLLVDHNDTALPPADNGTFLRFSPTSASTSAAASSPGRPGNVYVYVWLFLGLLVFLLTLLIISLHRLKNIISSSSSVPDCSSEGGSSFTNMEICSISSQRSTMSSLSTWGGGAQRRRRGDVWGRERDTSWHHTYTEDVMSWRVRETLWLLSTVTNQWTWVTAALLSSTFISGTVLVTFIIEQIDFFFPASMWWFPPACLPPVQDYNRIKGPLLCTTETHASASAVQFVTQ